MPSKAAAALARDDRVRRVELKEPRALVTVDVDHPVWKDGSAARPDPATSGAIVRLRPPHTASDADVERVRAHYQNGGAVRVTVLPRLRSEVIPADVSNRRPEKAIGARQAVLEIVEETNSKDRELLLALCEKIMAENGL